MKSGELLAGLGLVTMAFASAPALAVQPKPIPLGDGAKVTPTLDLSASYDDNIYQSSANDTSSWITSVEPGALLDVVRGANHYQLGYTLDSEYVHEESDNNNVDHHLRGSAIFGLTRTSRIELYGNYDRVENIFDTTLIGENDKFESSGVSAVYGYGSSSSPFAMDVGVRQNWFRSLNSGTLNAFREYDNAGATVTTYFQVMPKTRLLLEYNYDDFDYQQDTAGLDSEKNTAFVGATWTATARTQGTVKIGYEDREFDDPGRDDNSGMSWQVDVGLQPTKRDTVNLTSFQGTQEGSIEEDFVDTTKYGINWNRQFSTRVSGDLNYSYAENDYEDQLGREDEITTLGGEVRYDVSRQFTVGVGYKYEDRDSTQSARSYDRNIYLLNLNLSL